MKRLVILIVLLSLLLTGCRGKNTADAQVIIGDSLRFTQTEIEAAMNVVMDHFEDNFVDCTLTRIEYVESRTWVTAIKWAQRYDADEAIILLSDFDVSEDSTNTSLGPGSTHIDWTWILTRVEGGEWELQSWGYAP